MISNRLTEALGIRHPIISAPMAFAAGGQLAASVSDAGGLGLIGGAYGDDQWVEEQFLARGGSRVGVGFITWSIQENPGLLENVLSYKPAAVMLSFGNPSPIAQAVLTSGSKLICQCQNMRHVGEAIDAGAHILVAQGSEAGGHGATRGTFSFVPEVVDYCSKNAADVMVVAAGGIADGRGLAASMMLGADGVLIGTRLWASNEALVGKNHHAAIVSANGDDTLRTNLVDIVRQLPWPQGFSARVHKNAYVERWYGREEELLANLPKETNAYNDAFAADDPNNTAVWFGEAAGLIDRIEPARDIVENVVADATRLLTREQKR